MESFVYGHENRMATMKDKRHFSFQGNGQRQSNDLQKLQASKSVQNRI